MRHFFSRQQTGVKKIKDGFLNDKLLPFNFTKDIHYKGICTWIVWHDVRDF